MNSKLFDITDIPPKIYVAKQIQQYSLKWFVNIINSISEQNPFNSFIQKTSGTVQDQNSLILIPTPLTLNPHHGVFKYVTRKAYSKVRMSH